MLVDPRVTSAEKLVAPFPLPHISRRSLRRIDNPLPVPESCPYCSGSVELISNSHVYGKSHGTWPYLYSCQCCDAYVGLHPHTDLPLGSMADKRLRGARMQGKEIFYRLMHSLKLDRNNMYPWLAGHMNLFPAECHWAMFDEEQCDIAAGICQKAIRKGELYEQ